MDIVEIHEISRDGEILNALMALGEVLSQDPDHEMQRFLERIFERGVRTGVRYADRLRGIQFLFEREDADEDEDQRP